LAFHQQATDELGCDLLSGSGEEGWGEGLKVLGGRGGYGSGLGVAWGWVRAIGTPEVKVAAQRKSQAMQIYSYPHKPQIGHQVVILLIHGQPKRWHVAD